MPGRRQQRRQQKAALRNKHITVEDTAAERAVNAKQYLVTEKGIDAARVSVATSAANGQTVEDYLVPPAPASRLTCKAPPGG